MTSRIDLTRIPEDPDGKKRLRDRVINQNFQRIRDRLVQMSQGTDLVAVAEIDHGLLAGLEDDDHTQYHTDGRALIWLGTRSTTDLPEGTNLYWTDARALAWLGTRSTDDLPEGVTALYYTDARVAAYLASLASTHGDILYYNGSAWVALAPGSAGQHLRTEGAGSAPTWETPTGGVPPTDFDLLTDGVSSLVFSGGDVTWIIY
jgi:hypothetical protein